MQPCTSSNKFSLTPHVEQGEDSAWMKLALQQAELAIQADEVPIGAALVLNGKPIAVGHNSPVSMNDACAHAEILTIRQACSAISNYRLGSEATLYVTLQPCLMCLGAILHARIGRVVMGCSQSRYNGDLKQTLAAFEQAEAWHPCAFETGCMAPECEQLLNGFFKVRRKKREQAVGDLASLMHLPNVNKETLEELSQLGFHDAHDFLLRGLDKTSEQLAARSNTLKAQQKNQQAAILASLCDYFSGEPVHSWKHYL